MADRPRRVPRTRWFERKFSFDFPATEQVALRRLLGETACRIEAAISGLAAEQLTRRRGADWSIQENVGHLFDLEELWEGRLRDYLEGVATLRPADLENRRTEQAGHNEPAFAEVLESFRSARDTLLDRLARLAESDFERSAGHPRLGTPMRLVDMLRFIADHDQHHLEMIEDLIPS